MSRESQNRNATRTRILDAAELLLEKTSSQSFKVADIATEAGVSPSLVIQYFNSKDELVFETCLRRMLRDYPEVFAPKDALRSLWDLIAFCVERDLRQSHIVTDLLSLSWRWKPEEEQRFYEAAAPRTARLRDALALERPKASADELEELVGLVQDYYTTALRRACIHKLGPAEMISMLRPVVGRLLAAWKS